MPKQLLSGSIDEQCEFLYTLAQEKMQQGNFTGAVHALREVVKYRPDFRDAQQLLTAAKSRKSTQSRLLIAGLLGAVVGVGVGTVSQISNDLVLIGLAVIGMVVGYAIGNFLESFRQNDDLPSIQEGKSNL